MGNFKKIIISISFLSTICFIVFLYLFFSVPRKKIDSLVNGFVVVALDNNNQPHYNFVKKKPYTWSSYNEISKPLRDAIVISEDWAFYEHQGVDYSQIKKALEAKLTKGQKLRGASTISQQLVKNLFYTKKRSFWRKAKEYFTVQYLEKKIGKKKILESYLNIIEYGKKTYGIKKATALYFKKKPLSLSAKEGAFLAMLLPSPFRNAESFRKKKLTLYGKETISKILLKMKKAKLINSIDYNREVKKQFNWIKKKTSLLKKSKQESTPPLEKLVFKSKKSKRKKNKKINYEKSYRRDIKIDVDDNPNFDDDALKENIGGIKEEFSL